MLPPPPVTPAASMSVDAVPPVPCSPYTVPRATNFFSKNATNRSPYSPGGTVASGLGAQAAILMQCAMLFLHTHSWRKSMVPM